MGRRPRGGLDGDHTRPGGSALIGRENGWTFVRCYGPAASRPRCRWGIGAPGVSAKSALPSVVIEHGPSLKSPLGGEGPSLRYCARDRGRRPRTQRRLAERFACCRSTLVVECDDDSSHLAICRKSSQNASSKLAPVLCPATIERLMIENFMVVPRQDFAINRE